MKRLGQEDVGARFRHADTNVGAVKSADDDRWALPAVASDLPAYLDAIGVGDHDVEDHGGYRDVVAHSGQSRVTRERDEGLQPDVLKGAADQPGKFGVVFGEHDTPGIGAMQR